MSVDRRVAAIATVMTAVALFLPTRTQTFTRVDVAGRTLRMLEIGEGGATVVFENGLGGSLEHWGKVQPAVSRFARTVSYDRAGAGLSNNGPLPRDGHRIAGELRSALETAGVPPPYILVGASVGGLYVRVFAGLFPHDVAGMVLVDPTWDAGAIAETRFPELVSLPSTVEQARASAVPSHPDRGVPIVLIDAVSPVEVPFATAAIRDLRAKQRSDIAAESAAYKAWVDSVPGARLIVTNRSGHNVAQEQPELVIDTVRHVVQEVTTR